MKVSRLFNSIDADSKPGAQKDNFQNPQILNSPTNSPDPIKPKKKLIVILAMFNGVFTKVFLSFILEYISKNKIQKLSAGLARY